MNTATTPHWKTRLGFLSELRRYPAQGWIAGVCAGIADYFDWKPKIVRLVTALLFIFTAGTVFFFAYLVLWFLLDDGDALPGARPKWQSATPSAAAFTATGTASTAPPDLRDLKERFSRLDDRLRRMEEASLSSDAALKREIEKL